uniref:Uncharacterized protein n=1 Tax=Opuntia streptacantha TaxID=393608 RepID=A0A7C9AQ59_OPUST
MKGRVHNNTNARSEFCMHLSIYTHVDGVNTQHRSSINNPMDMSSGTQYLAPLHFLLCQCMIRSLNKIGPMGIFYTLTQPKRNLTLVFLVKTKHPTITPPQICSWKIVILGK